MKFQTGTSEKVVVSVSLKVLYQKPNCRGGSILA